MIQDKQLRLFNWFILCLSQILLQLTQVDLDLLCLTKINAMYLVL